MVVARRGLLSALGASALAAAMVFALPACSPSAQSQLPDLGFTQLDGSQHKLAEFKGHVTLINFWATSCGTCIKEMPDLVATYQMLRPQGLETLAVAMEYDPPAYVMQFVQSRQLPFTVAMDHTGELAKAFGPVQLTPTTFVVNKKGEIVKQYIGAPDFKALQALLTQLLAEPA